AAGALAHEHAHDNRRALAGQQDLVEGAAHALARRGAGPAVARGAVEGERRGQRIGERERRRRDPGRGAVGDINGVRGAADGAAPRQPRSWSPSGPAAVAAAATPAGWAPATAWGSVWVSK